jgi:Mrp family chromosome partitioning ATPase
MNLPNAQIAAIAMDIGVTLPPNELTRLCRAIEGAVSHADCHIVQFLSAYPGEGSSVIAFEAAIVAATLLGKRVLYIDSQSPQRHNFAKTLAAYVSVPLDVPTQEGISLQHSIVTVERTKLFYATLQNQEAKNALPDFEGFHSTLQTLRASFDLIIIDSPAILTHVFSSVLAKLCDGCILVIEAERTRAPVAAEAIQLIESSGGRVLGTVLNKRRFYIPQWLYRLLYRKKETRH